MRKAIALITDSASDFTFDEAAALDIKIVPLSVTFPNDKTYLDRVELDADRFYDMLVESADIPTTSQPSPQSFAEAFNEALQDADEVVYCGVSGELSGTLESARIARDLLAPNQIERVHIVDTLNVTLGEQILVRLAVNLRDKGLDAQEIVRTLEEYRKHVKVIALLDTLEYLKKGGRIPATAAAAGTLLSIKPVICVKDGKIGLLGAARGSKNGKNQLSKHVVEAGGVDFSLPFVLGYSGHSERLLKKYWEDSTALYADWEGEMPVSKVGSVIGTHVGPGAIAVAFFGNN